jgi:hypothetical protein
VYHFFLGGAVAMLAATTELFPEYTGPAIKYFLLPVMAVGGLLIAIAKLNRIDGE